MYIRLIEYKDKLGVEKLLEQLVNHKVFVNIKNMVNNPNCICAVMENTDGKIIAHGALVIRYVPTSGEVGRFEDIIVDENHRGGGYARMICNFLIKKATKDGIVKIDLSCNPNRIAAGNLYASLGFKKINTNVMVKNL